MSRFLRYEIASPADREVIDRLVWSKTAFPPVEMDVLVGARQGRSTPQIFIAEIFPLQAPLAIGCSNKFGVLKHFVERRRVDRIQDSGSGPQPIADAFQIAHCVERLGFSAASAPRPSRKPIGPNHPNR